MSTLSRWRVLSVGSAVVLSTVISLNLALAQGKSTAKAKPAAADAAPAKVTKGRLPPYYKDIVDARQKEQIYTLQADFNSKIDALKEQIEKLTADRDAAVENVLTPAQKEKLKVAKETAAAKKKKPDADKSEDGGKTAE